MKISSNQKWTTFKDNGIFEPSLNWKGIFIVSIISTVVYIFMEWLFIITKPSFFTSNDINSELGILVNTVLLAVTVDSLFLTLMMLISFIPYLHSFRKPLIILVFIIPSFITAALSLLLIDNFSYTILGFGIVTSQSIVRAVYAVMFIALLFVWFDKVLQLASRFSKWISHGRWQNVKAIILQTTIVFIVLMTIGNIAKNINEKPEISAINPIKPTHIFLITGDGVNAENMSAYGYQRNTTPNLLELSSSSLVANNSFTNSSSTQGSIISIFTGKYPTETRVLYPPNILVGQNAYQHLPGILRSHGYYSIQISFPHYVDASSANLLDGFDITNQKAADASTVTSKLSKFMKTEDAFFLYELFTRIDERIAHIFFIKKMTNPFDQILQPPDRFGDIDKINSLIRLINESDRTLFVHLHLMDTHGPTFTPSIRNFSRFNAGQTFWDEDFYDDAILNFDNNIGMIVTALTKKGLFDKSIIIIGSDHGQQWSSTDRIPLIIHFPNGEFSRKVSSNVQNIDIAPTILDYLGLQKPDWMDGESFLRNDPPNKPIFSSGLYGVETDPEKGIIIKANKIHPPYFQFGKVSLVYCKNWYQLNLVDFNWEFGKVRGSTVLCRNEDPISEIQALNLLENHLKKYGFDTSNLANKAELR